MYALVDCNNFYCSCERVFNPKLNNRGVVVLSNNDGCIISRSDEVKAAGIAMGSPVFMLQEQLQKNDIAIFSSNYTLYGDMSNRVMETLSGFVPGIEIYSIDEAFLDLHYMPYTDLTKLGITMKRAVQQNTGIPVCVGIAPTKTLAKMANHYAKKKYKALGVFWAANKNLIHEMLSATAVKDIWGIGHQYALLLQRNGFETAADFINASDDWVREKMSVVGLRLLNELRGIPAIQWQWEAKPKKNICTSRSFGKRITELKELEIAVANYASLCGLKLREQNSCCNTLNIFIHTNPHKTQERQYSRAIDIDLLTATNDTGELIQYALKGLRMIYKKGYKYMKAGVIVSGLVKEKEVQASLFDKKNRARDGKLMEAMDAINQSLGRDTVRMAVQGFERRYKLRADYLSPKYTTDINQVLKVKI